MEFDRKFDRKGYPRIDLHIHSSFSDGTCTPEEIVVQAREKNMDLIALTDHNTLAGAERFRRAARKEGQKAAVGIELTSGYQTADQKMKEIHVLGYFPLQADMGSEKFALLNRRIREYGDSKYLQLENILENLAEDYPELSVQEFYAYIESKKADKNYNRVHIANYLMHRGLAHTVNECFERFLSEKQKYYVRRKQITVEEAVDAIKEAGGLCIIAHPAEYHFSDEEMEQFFRHCMELSVDGVEVFHPSDTEEEVGRILKLFQKLQPYPFLISTGSDFHGANKVNSMGKGFFYDMEQSVFCEMYEESCRLMYSTLCTDLQISAVQTESGAESL